MTRPLSQDAPRPPFDRPGIARSLLAKQSWDLWVEASNARQGMNWGSSLESCAALDFYRRTHPNPHVRAIASDPEELYRLIQTGPEAA